MDPISLGTLLAGLIVGKALDRAADETVDAGAGGIGRLVARVRERLGASKDERVGTALDRVDDAPDSPSRERELGAAIGELLEHDPGGIYGELRGVIEQAQRDGVQLSGPISQSAEHTTGPVTQIAGNVSDVHITQSSEIR